MMSKLMVCGLAAAAAVGIVATAPASADISQVVLRIEASNANGTGAWNAMINTGEFGPDGTYSWTLSSPVEIRSTSGALLATLTSGSTYIVEDPLVSLGFSVQAGGMDTTFQITSALLSFPGINPAEGRVSGGITGTDITGDGVSLTGVSGASMISAQHDGIVPTGTTFADLIAGPLTTMDAFGSVSESEASPASGFTPIGGTVSDISLRYAFTLTAGDIASGTATFVVLPAPGAAGVLALAGVAALRRRRR